MTGITTATVHIEGSFNGTDYDLISGGEFTADGCSKLTVAYPYVRANCTAYTAGTISVWLGE